MPEDDFPEALRYLSRLCHELGVRWALIGGVASNLYRDRPRLTQDVDVTIEVDRGQWSSLAARLRTDGWTLHPEVDYPDVVLLRAQSRLAIDVLVAKTEYQRIALDRVIEHAMEPELRIPVLAPEDIIVHKLIAGRHTDIDDVERILASRPDLDRTYLEHWIAQWALIELWDAVRGGR